MMVCFDPIAEHFDDLWDFGREYNARMHQAIIQHLHLTDADVLADIGGGTGKELIALQAKLGPFLHSPFCVEPSAKMLTQAEHTFAGKGLACHFEHQTAERFVADPPERGSDKAGITKFLIKETLHHIESRGIFWAHLRNHYPDSTALVITRPTLPGFPLFKAALAHFAAGQPTLAALLREWRWAALPVEVDEVLLPITLTKTRWFDMLRGRFMSDLMGMTDAEIEAGIQEIDTTYPDIITFEDRLLFITVGEGA